MLTESTTKKMMDEFPQKLPQKFPKRITKKIAKVYKIYNKKNLQTFTKK